MKTPSIQVFRSFIETLSDGTLDASGVISRDCYEAWLSTRTTSGGDSEQVDKRFYRILTNHLSGVDGRTPFTIVEEAAILHILRQRRAWPCLSPKLAHLGERYRSKGYHEKLMQKGSMSTIQYLPPPTSCTNNDEDNIASILSRISPEAAQHVNVFATNIVRNFANPHFSLEGWKTVNQIFRYWLFAHTTKCMSETLPSLRMRAEQLCNKFSIGIERGMPVACLVLDFTSKAYGERALAQNEYSREMFGSFVNNDNITMVDGSDLYRVALAIAVALQHPGMHVEILQQRMQGHAQPFDMTYYFDHDSHLMVISGSINNNFA